MVGTIQRRPNQGVHAGTDANEAHFTLALRLRHSRD